MHHTTQPLWRWCLDANTSYFHLFSSMVYFSNAVGAQQERKQKKTNQKKSRDWKKKTAYEGKCCSSCNTNSIRISARKLCMFLVVLNINFNSYYVVCHTFRLQKQQQLLFATFKNFSILWVLFLLFFSMNYLLCWKKNNIKQQLLPSIFWVNIYAGFSSMRATIAWAQTISRMQKANKKKTDRQYAKFYADTNHYTRLTGNLKGV